MTEKLKAVHKMYLQEIEQRAWMFFHLKRSREYAAARIMQNLKWEFECAPQPGLEKRVTEIINYVYKN